MKILSRLAERIGKMFRLETANAAEAFGVKLLTSSDMDSALNKWNDIFTGKPPWKDAEDEIDTANVASLISNTRSSPRSLLIREDLPTFGFPIITVFNPSLSIFPLSAESYNFLISFLNSKDFSSISL